uniref:Cilia- and flagella-associated protein 58 central coiled coil domain-containing protein n=2 Tax=Spongospora subterranea TaxID=70186 RepID=A0A0H5RB53_9EUKA|eukprot:CRZ11036.1 hypothetical protein [Spongospora subterranea]
MKSGSTLSTRLTQLNEEAQDLEDKFQTQQDYTEEVLKSIASLRSSCDTDKATLAATTKESKRKLSMLEKLKEKMQVADEDLRSIEATRGLWNEKIEQKKNELKVANTAAAVALRAIDIASREREILNHDHATMMEGLSGKRNALHIAENQSRNMEIELKAFDVSIKAWKTLIDQLAQDTDTFKNELEVKQARTKKAMEKSAAKDSQVMGMQKMIIEHETKRRQQMNLLEAVKSDRNLYTKTLLEQKHEMNEYKRSFDSLNHSISHMQQELNDKESAFVNENLLVEQADDDIRQTDLKTKHIHECYLATNERVQVQSTQIANLSRIIDEADEELQAQTKQYNAVVNEERVLSRQLVKRNEELSEIYEQLRLHHSMMHKGEIHYKERREVFSKLEALQSALTAELNSIDVDRSEIDELKSAIIRLEKSLSKETLKARVLEDELKKPMNIHRWRQLQDTSADTFTLIESVQGLQKSIIAKSAELAAKDAKIEQREKLYVDLRRIQARQIGQEVHEQLRIYEAEIKEKTGKHKIMLIELKLCQARVHELKYEIENVYKSLDLVKLTYFQRQRAETRAKSRLTAKSGEESHSLFARYDGFSSKGSLDFDLKVYDEGNETQKHIEGEITLKK